MTHAIIIDDNANNVGILAALLDMQSVSSTPIVNPLKLAAALAESPPADVIFLDLELPGSNGYEVFAALRGDACFESVPIVACTVHLNEIGAARKFGFHSFIGKPLDMDRFGDQLERILRGERVWSAW